MIPSRALFNQLATLLAADSTTIGSATAMKVHLAVAPFTPGLDLSLGTLTEATFTGYAALLVGTGGQLVYYDVATGYRTIELLAPAGGWHWGCTVAPTPAQTVSGLYVTDGADANLWGSVLLPAPVSISAAGQGIDVAPIKFAFLQNSPF